MRIEEKTNESLAVRPYDNQMKRSKELHPSIPQPPFSMLICSPKGGGKTTLLLNLLYKRHNKKNAFYRHYFDTIYVFSPTFRLDKKLQKMKIPESQIYEDQDDYEDIIQEIIATQQEEIEAVGKDKANSILMIFDDLAGTKMFSHNRSILNRLALNSRHYKISIIITSQQSNLINTAFRTNLSAMIIFGSCLNNRAELKRLRDEYLGQFTNKEVKQLLNYVFDDSKYNFLYLNFQSHGQLINKNFNPLQIKLDSDK